MFAVKLEPPKPTRPTRRATVRGDLSDYARSTFLAFVCCGPIWACTPESTTHVAQRGELEQIKLEAHGVPRSYLLYTPAVHDEAAESPLVLLFHGGHGSARDLVEHTGFNSVADQGQFLIAYPDSVEGHWNDGRPETETEVDDVAFVDALLVDVARRRKVDAQRVYAAGISNGGSFTARLACERAGRFAALAQVVSTMAVKLYASCKPERPVPMLIMNGTDDPLHPWRGGALRKSGRLGKGGEVIGTEHAARFWADHDDCTGREESELPDREPADGTRVRAIHYTHCSLGSEVLLLAIEGGGHAWPGAPERPFLARLTGRTSRDIDGSEVIWEFVSKHRLQ